MSAFPASDRLLSNVRARLTARCLAGRTFWALLAFAGLYAALLLTGRLTGLFPHWFTFWSVALVPALSLLAAWLWPGRPDRVDAARAIDRRQSTHDLFLTLATLEATSAAYFPLVGRDAEQRAAGVCASSVVPFPWERRAVLSASVMGLLLLAAALVPTLDPFGKVAQANEQEEARKLLEETRRQTESRKAQLAQKQLDNENSEEVEQALAALKEDLQQTRKAQQKLNHELLMKHQKELGEMYRNLNAGPLKSLFEKALSDQQLGQLNNQDLFRKWQQELQEGRSDALEQALEKLRNDLKQLAQASDPLERSELERKIQKDLKELSDFSRKKAGSPSLQAALERVRQQVDAARQEGLTNEAMEALQESLEVAQAEMKSLAQASRDLKDLDEALQLISMARQLNSQDELDGEQLNSDELLEEYAKMFQELLAQRGPAEEQGEGGGPPVDEDDTGDVAFKNEKATSPIQQGKILMSLKTKGLSEAGEMADAEYQRVVGEIRQSLESVLNQEEIPPGYVDGIKKYFDTLEKSTP